MSFEDIISWLHKSAEQGYSPAQNELGKYYLQHLIVGKAFNLFVKSAEQNDSIGQYYLAMCYRYGFGVKQDRATAWILMAKSGTHVNPTDSYYNASFGEIELILIEYIEQTKIIKKMTKKIEQLTATIEELKITVPIEGGMEYQIAKARFNEYMKKK